MSRALLYAALASGVLFISACSHSENIEARSGPPRAQIVAVVKAEPESLARRTVLSAEFRPYQEVEIHAKVAGYVKRIYVDVGDRVKQGQVLATLEIPEMTNDLTRAAAAREHSSSEVQRARDGVLRAESAHEAAHLSYQRLSAVSKQRPNLVAQQELDDAEARDRVSEASVAEAKSGLASAQQQVQVSTADEDKTKTLFDYSRITAPFAGVISKRFADTGSMIQAGTASQTQAMPVVRLSQIDRLRLVLQIPESVVPHIRIGEPVEVRVPTLNRTFTGTVSRFSDRVAPATRTMETEVDVFNPGFVLIPGMYAEAVLTLEKHDNALAVPVQSIVTRDGIATVMLVGSDHRLEQRSIKTGIETAEKVEVLSGLHAGDQVVIGNRSQLKSGEEVETKLVATRMPGGDR